MYVTLAHSNRMYVKFPDAKYHSNKVHRIFTHNTYDPSNEFYTNLWLSNIFLPEMGTGSIVAH